MTDNILTTCSKSRIKSDSGQVDTAKRLSIAIYSSPLRSIIKPTGVGQHILHMSRLLSEHHSISPVILASRHDYNRVKPYLPESLANASVKHLPRAERLVRSMLIATNALHIEKWSGDVDWVYCPKEQPIRTRNARLAVTVHDILPLEKKVYGLSRKFRLSSWLRWRTIMRRILQRADLIATVSAFTQDRIIEHFPEFSRKRFVTVGNGVNQCYFRHPSHDDSNTLTRYSVTPGQYLMSVGSLTHRKGGDLLLDLARILLAERSQWEILITGQTHDSDLIHRLNEMRKEYPQLPLRLLGYVEQAELAKLLTHSLTLLFPSRYEGFGIPALEAMAAGAPVICSRSAAIPETVGNAALSLESTQAEDLLNAIQQIERDSSLRNQFINAGRQRSLNFTWNHCAARLIEEFRQ